MTATEQGWSTEPRRGTGWITFAAVLLIASGAFKILDALWAFKYDDDVSERVETIVFEHDLQSWGWVWLIAGVLLVLTGIAVLQGSELGRWIGVLAGSLAVILNYPWIFVEPLWTILNVTLAIFAIYGLVAYGGSQLRQES